MNAEDDDGEQGRNIIIFETKKKVHTNSNWGDGSRRAGKEEVIQI